MISKPKYRFTDNPQGFGIGAIYLLDGVAYINGDQFYDHSIQAAMQYIAWSAESFGQSGEQCERYEEGARAFSSMLETEKGIEDSWWKLDGVSTTFTVSRCDKLPEAATLFEFGLLFDFSFTIRGEADIVEARNFMSRIRGMDRSRYEDILDRTVAGKPYRVDTGMSVEAFSLDSVALNAMEIKQVYL